MSGDEVAIVRPRTYAERTNDTSTPVARIHVTINGDEIDLSGLTRQEAAFLERAMAAFEAREAFPNFLNFVNEPGSPALQGGQWVTEEVAASALYRVCQDLGDRLGVSQGFLSASPDTGGSPRGVVSVK